jgi:hypothetical protein
MPWGRVLAVAAAVSAVCWLSLDSGVGGTEPAPPMVSTALRILAAVFGASAWSARVTGRYVERAPWLAGLSIGVGAYALLRLTV